MTPLEPELQQVRHAAFQLALASQAIAEDEEFAVIGQELVDSDINGGFDGEVVQLACTNPACRVHYTPLNMDSIQKAATSPDRNAKLHQCSGCGLPACVACVAHRGSSNKTGIPLKEAAILCKRYSRTSAHIPGFHCMKWMCRASKKRIERMRFSSISLRKSWIYLSICPAFVEVIFATKPLNVL